MANGDDDNESLDDKGSDKDNTTTTAIGVNGHINQQQVFCEEHRLKLR